MSKIEGPGQPMFGTEELLGEDELRWLWRGKKMKKWRQDVSFGRKGLSIWTEKDVACGTKSTPEKLGESENRYRALRVTKRDTEEYVGVHTRRKVERMKQKGEPKQKW
jgi:hypothetical protein